MFQKCEYVKMTIEEEHCGASMTHQPIRVTAFKPLCDFCFAAWVTLVTVTAVLTIDSSGYARNKAMSEAGAQGREKSAADALFSGRPFSADKNILATWKSKNRPEGLDVELILSDAYYKMESDGRVTSNYHTIFRVLTQQGLDAWAYSTAEYYPWYQKQPVIRTRIVSSDGREQFLDPTSLVETSVAGNDGIYSDKKRISAPLPSVRVGSLVEELVTVEEHRAYFSAGRTMSYTFNASTYTGMMRLRIEFPTAATLNYRMRGKEVKPVVTKTGGWKRLTFVMRDVRPLESYPPLTDPSIAIVPSVAFSLATDWQSVASAYSDMVDKQLEGFDARVVLKDILAPSDTKETRLKKLVDFIHSQVRYEAYELGDKSLIPVRPEAVLERRFGDCKDKATLLLGLLRADGFHADLALLAAGPGLDSDPAVPGLGFFNHVIVYVESNPSLWIDASADYAGVGILPSQDQDRLALIVSHKTKAPVKIPSLPSEQNGFVEDVTVRFVDNGPATVEEVTIAKGAQNVTFRAEYDAPVSQLKSRYEEYSKSKYGSPISSIITENVKDTSKDVRLTLKIDRAENMQSYDDGAYFQPTSDDLFVYLPTELTAEPVKKKDQKNDPKYQSPPDLPLYIYTPHRVEVLYHLIAPKGFMWPGSIEQNVRMTNGITLSKSVDMPSEREMNVIFAVQTDTRIIPFDKIASVAKDIREFQQTAFVRLRYVHSADYAIQNGEVAKGIKLHQELVRTASKEVLHKVRYAEALLRLGYGETARRLSQEAAKADPTSARAAAGLAWLYYFDTFGREGKQGSDYKKVRDGYRKAHELSPKDPSYREQLVTLLLTNNMGIQFGKGAYLDEAIQTITKFRDLYDDKTHDEDLLRAYMWKGRFKEAAVFAAKVAESDNRNALWTAAVAASEGAAAAKQKAEDLAPGNSAKVLYEAASVLAVMLSFDAALKVASLPEVKQYSAASTDYVDAIIRARNEKECLKDMHAAARVVFDLTQQLVGGTITFEEAVKRVRQSAAGEYFDEENIREYAKGLTSQLSFASPFAASSLACSNRMETEEKAGAVRVKFYIGKSREPTGVFYLAKNRQGYFWVGMETYPAAEAESKMAFRAISNNRLEEAAVWIEWAKQSLKKYGPEGESYTLSDAARDFIDSDLINASGKDLRIDAALLDQSNTSDEHIKILEAAKKSISGNEKKRWILDWAVANLLLRKKSRNAALQFESLHRTRPEDISLWQSYITALKYDGDSARRRSEAMAYAAKFPDDAFPKLVLQNLDLADGKWNDVKKETMDKIADRKISAPELNNVAWAALIYSDDYTDAVKAAEAALEISPNSASYLHTSATLYAETGEPVKARAKLMESIQREPDLVDEYDWYVLGRIAESIGLRDEARRAYAKITKPKEPDPMHCYHLVQKRMRINPGLFQ
jgi:tetratricopeptide (TPR) repeat protein/transglutaminase-like putative cysteine protease